MMYIGKIPEFNGSTYFKQSVTDLEEYKKKIFTNDTLKFSYKSVNFNDYSHTARPFSDRAINFLFAPIGTSLNIIVSVAKLAFELLGFTLNVIGQTLQLSQSFKERTTFLKREFQNIKNPVYCIVRHIEKIVGHLISPFHDKAGAFLEQNARFQQDCYGIHEEQSLFLAAIKSQHAKLNLTDFHDMSEKDREEILNELSSHPRILKGALIKPEDDRYKAIFALDKKILDILTVTDLTRNSAEVKCALMSPEDIQKLSINNFTHTTKKILHIVSIKLEGISDTVADLPKKLSDLSVAQLRGLNEDQLKQVILKLPHQTLNLLTKDQINGLNFASTPFTGVSLNKFLKEFKTISPTEAQIFELAKRNQTFKSDELLQKENYRLLFSLLSKEHFEEMTLTEEKLKILNSLFTLNKNHFADKVILFNALKNDELKNNSQLIPSTLLNFISDQKIKELDVKKLSKQQINALFPDPQSQEGFTLESTFWRVNMAIHWRNTLLFKELSEEDRLSIRDNLDENNKKILASIAST